MVERFSQFSEQAHSASASDLFCRTFGDSRCSPVYQEPLLTGWQGATTRVTRDTMVQARPLERVNFDPLQFGFGNGAILPPGVPGVFDSLPPSPWIDMQCFDSSDARGNLIRQFRDGHTLAVSRQFPIAAVTQSGILERRMQLDANGQIIQAVEVDRRTGGFRQRPDFQGGLLDGYGSVHRIDGVVERPNGLVSPNEQAYVIGLVQGFPERAYVQAQNPYQWLPYQAPNQYQWYQYQYQWYQFGNPNSRFPGNHYYNPYHRHQPRPYYWHR